MSRGRLPYPGLRAFTSDESDIFFGRDGCVDAMVDRLAATRFLAVLGPSGGGKSSLVRTGLFDALELGLHPWAGSRWQVADLHPGGQPIRNLAAALIESRGASGDPLDVEMLATFLRNGPRSIIEWVAHGNVPADTNLLVLVDQFEELFRYGEYAQRQEAEALVGLLIESASAPLPIHVILTMRSEYLGACSLIPGLAEMINGGMYLTPRMSRDECRDAIEGPARVIGFHVQPALVNRLLNDLATFAPWEGGQTIDDAEPLSRRADQLPLMQHVLNRLWLQRETDELTLDAYERLGGLSGALDAHGAEVLASLGDERAASVETVFRALVSGTTAATAVRRPCRLGELVELVNGDREAVVAVIEAFRAPDCNFLRTSEASLASDDVIVDISHESLIRQWSPLTTWLSKETRDAAIWRRLVASQERFAAGEGGLLSGLDLHSLQTWWDAVEPTPAWARRHGANFGATQVYYEASRRNEALEIKARQKRERRERSRLRALAALLIVITGYAILLTVRARSREKSAKADAEQAQSEKRNLKAAQAQGASVLKPITGGLSKIAEVNVLRSPSDATEAATAAIRREYDRGMSLEPAGKAHEAVGHFAIAWQKGRTAIDALPAQEKPDEELEADTLAAGYRYAWALFDNRDDVSGEEVMLWMTERAAARGWSPGSTPLLLQYAYLENLRSRYFHDRKRTAESDRASARSLALASRAAAAVDASMEAFRLQFMLLDSDANALQGAARARRIGEACRVATLMLKKDPRDPVAVGSQVECLRSRAFEARAAGNLAAEGRRLHEAHDLLQKAVTASPEHQPLTLKLAQVHNDLSDLYLASGNGTKRRAHQLEARNYFVRALKNRTAFQTATNQLKTIYDGFSQIEFSKPSNEPYSRDELAFYQGVADAIQPTFIAFPRVKSVAWVAANAAERVGTLLSNDPRQQRAAERYLSAAIDAFRRSGTLDDIKVYSEDFTRYCDVYVSRATLYARTGRLDDMRRDVERMKKACDPVLANFDWDFYLRQKFWKAARVAGTALLEHGLYEEAAKHLQYLSHWGNPDGSKLLARLYRENRPAADWEQKATELEELAKRQTVRRLTLDADFKGVRSPFHVYIIDWPKDYRHEGIEDQVKWLDVARGGTVSDEVRESLRKLHRIARENNLSYPDLCVYALNLANGDEQTGSKTNP